MFRPFGLLLGQLTFKVMANFLGCDLEFYSFLFGEQIIAWDDQASFGDKLLIPGVLLLFKQHFTAKDSIRDLFKPGELCTHNSLNALTKTDAG